MKNKNKLILLGILTGIFISDARAQYMEVSGGFSFNRTNYDGESFYWTRRWTGSMAYHFTERSGLELALQDVTERTFIKSYQDTTFHDQIYSISWIQDLLPKGYLLQPYFKLGIGQLNREAEGSYAGGGVPPPRVDSITGVVSLGFRLFLLKRFAIRTEATTYLTGGSVRTWKDNIAYMMGISIFF